MGERSSIQWTDSSWNPWRGCDKVSPGCAHCYMFRDQERYGRDPSTVVRAADPTFYAPIRNTKWKREREAAIAERGRHFVFTCSWSDWFHEDADPWRDEAWEIIRQTPQSIYQILTKRPERIAECLPTDWGGGFSNVWLGTSIENRRYVERADLLRAVPAAVRFISAEPLLGPLVYDGLTAHSWLDNPADPYLLPLDLTDIHWLITGGESGPNHRPFDPVWANDLRYRCEEEGVAFFHKQNGGPRPDSNGRLLDGRTWDEMPQPPQEGVTG